MDEVPSNRFKKKSILWPSLYEDFIERCKRNGTVPNFNLGHSPWEDIDTNCVSDKHYKPNNMNTNLIVKEDGICPVKNTHCDDECCPVGATCNLGPNSDLITSEMNNDDQPLPIGDPMFDHGRIEHQINALSYISPEELEKLYKQAGYNLYRSSPDPITMGIKETMVAVYEANKAKGFWDEKRNIGEMLMLVTSELAEALEANRKSRDVNIDGFRADMKNISISDDFVFDTTFEKDEFKLSFEQNIKDTFEDEIADAVIRLFDISAGLGIDLEFHIKAKMKYNSLRPYKHGKKY